MKTFLSVGIGCFGLFTILNSQPTVFQSESLQKVWETAGLNVPESVLPVPEKGILYVSNIGSTNPAEQEKKGFISVLNTDGSVKTMKWASGLNSPKGMAIKGKSLYVTEVNHLTEIDLSSGKIIRSIAVDSAAFLNDITTDAAGNLYISDSKVSTIFKFSDNKISVFLKSDRFGSPNGLLTDGKDILLGTGDRVVRINIQTGKVTDYMLNTGGVDGIALTASDVLLFSNWQGTVYKMKLGSDKELLLDTSKTEAIKSADFGYDASNKMIFLPTFFGNSVVCYKLAK